MKKVIFISLISLLCSYKTSANEQLKKEVYVVANEAILSGHIPGAVVLLGEIHKGAILYESYGAKSLDPYVSNALDTVYDLASVSKTFTALALGILVSNNKMTFDDPVANYIDSFKSESKKNITVRDMLLHKSGYPAVNYMSDYYESSSYEEMWNKLFDLELIYEPRTRSVYSDLGYMILSRIVEKVSHQNFSDFITHNIFEPIKMNETSFRPEGELLNRTAPTESDVPIGQPHDPRCRAIGGAAGNAGIFSTAKDMEKYVRFLLSDGSIDGKQVISTEILNEMTSIQNDEQRGLGFDINSSLSRYTRGDYLPKNLSFGHTGYTGTSIWVDKVSKIYLIILTNRVHAGDTSTSKIGLNKMRYQIANEFGKIFYNEVNDVNEGPIDF